MNKKTGAMIGAVAGLATMGAAHAGLPAANPAATTQVSSYADLLAPISNAVDMVRADDAARVSTPAVDGNVVPAQYYDYGRPPPRYHHHHHHHHHHAYYRHHHHHHHHHNTFVGIPGVGGVVVGNR